MKLAICEDQASDVQALTALLEQYRAEHPARALSYTFFPSAEALLSVQNSNYDCFLLDILMPGKNGIELARELRSRGCRGTVLYLTSSPDYALAAFSVRAAHYLLKPVKRDELFDALDMVAEQLAQARPLHTWQFAFRTPAGLQSTTVDKILYVEIVGHTPYYHLVGGTLQGSSLRVSFEESMAELMDAGCFLRPHRAYLVNVTHVAAVTTQALLLDNKSSIPIARTRSAEIRSQYLDFLMGGTEPMNEIALWRYLNAALTSCIIAPLEVVLLSSVVLLPYLLGRTVSTMWLAGTLLPAFCVLCFALCSDLRAGQFLFTLSSIAAITTVCEILASVFFTRNTMAWFFMRLGITCLLGALMFFFCRKPLAEMLAHTEVHWGQISLLPLSLCAWLTTYYVRVIDVGIGRTPLFPSLLLAIALMLVYVILYRFQRAIQDQSDMQSHAALLHSEVEYLQRQAELMGHANENMRVFRHDTRHYLSLLEGSLEGIEAPAAREILATMEQNILAGVVTSHSLYTGNLLLDTVLTRAAERASKLGVEFHAELELPDTLRVDMTELAVVVSNVLENAVTAAAKESPSIPRAVMVQTLPCNQQLFLVISNTFTGSVTLNERTGLPAAARLGHGYGTTSMYNFAQKYGCLLDCRLQNDTFHLRLLI